MRYVDTGALCVPPNSSAATDRIKAAPTMFIFCCLLLDHLAASISPHMALDILLVRSKKFQISNACVPIWDWLWMQLLPANMHGLDIQVAIPPSTTWYTEHIHNQVGHSYLVLPDAEPQSTPQPWQIMLKPNPSQSLEKFSMPPSNNPAGRARPHQTPTLPQQPCHRTPTPLLRDTFRQHHKVVQLFKCPQSRTTVTDNPVYATCTSWIPGGVVPYDRILLL